MKRLIINYSETNIVVYCIVRREADNYRLDDSNGSFSVNPADPYLALAEDAVIKGHYEVNENRTVWNDGLYTISFYKQVGSSPNPSNDTQIGSGMMYIKNDTEIVLNSNLDTLSSNLNNLDTYVNTNLDEKVSSRSSQTSVDEQSSDIDGLTTYVNTNLDTTISSRASEVNLNEKASNLDEDILSRASQVSLDEKAIPLANLDATVSSRASQESLNDKTAEIITTLLSSGIIVSVVMPHILQKQFYGLDKIAVFRNDDTQVIFNAKDEHGDQFIPNPERTYLFAVKKTINDTAYVIQPKILSIENNYLILNLTKEDTSTGYFMGVYEVTEVENYETENEKEHTLFQGTFEIKKDVIL